MKKIFICVLSVLLVCSLCACGNLKDTVLDGYDNLIQLFSKQVLTDDKDLVGERKYADDEYTGTYEDSDDIYEFTISSGDNYIVLKGEDFTGALTITVE